MRDYYSDNREKLLESVTAGFVLNSKREFDVVECEKFLVLRGPDKNQLSGFSVIVIVTFAGLIFACLMMPDVISTVPLFFLILGIVVYWGLAAAIYALISVHVKAGDYFVYDMLSGQIDFPRIGMVDNVENFVMIQKIKLKYYDSFEIAMVFRCGQGYKKYPLFLYDGMNIDSFLIEVSKKLGGYFQSVRFSGKKPVISGYNWE